jgi:hypothetical protein
MFWLLFVLFDKLFELIVFFPGDISFLSLGLFNNKNFKILESFFPLADPGISFLFCTILLKSFSKN